MHTETIQTDALVIGAGPVGLFQVFQLGLLEISAHVVDALPRAGGQCIELYPDKPIYDIPAVLSTTGRTLTRDLLQQIEPFKPRFHFGQRVDSLARQPDGRFLVHSDTGTRWLAKVVVIAAGVGAFVPKPLKVEGLDAYLHRQLHYHPEASVDVSNQQVLVIGGDDAAVDQAIHLASIEDAALAPRQVSLLHRREVLQAEPETVARMHALRATGKLQFLVGQVASIVEQEQCLVGVEIDQPDGSTQPLAVDSMHVYLGLSPKLGPIATWSLAMERKQLVVDTESFATSEPGIFAVGDINTYPGKKKLIVCGFHECVLAAYAAAALVFPQHKPQLQYTTTSPRLHELLGVKKNAPL